MTPTSKPQFLHPNPSTTPSPENQSPVSARRNSMTRDERRDVADGLDEKLTKASELLNTNKPREALALLLPSSGDAAAKAHYGFQSRLGNAFMGLADELVAANQLGSFLVTADSTGNWLRPSIHAERISCYLGVLGAYGRFLQILQQPEQRSRFIEKNSQETLELVESGVRAGISHAMLEPIIFLTRISQINSNSASQSFVSRSLQSGALKESDPVVRGFREVEADSLYHPILSATQCIQQAASESEQAPQMFWFEWLQNAKKDLIELPEYQLAAPYAS